VVGQVKTEFAKFGDVVEATRKSIDAAAKRFEQVDVRTRAIQRRLRGVQELPAPQEQEPPPPQSGLLLEDEGD
jgi:DNA recombination protein RmuC